jgi:hypothetical protein
MAQDLLNKSNITSSVLPVQKLPDSQKTKKWKEQTLNYYVNWRYTNGTSIRSNRNAKIINYDLYNGVVTPNDVVKMCDPLGVVSGTFSDTFQHLDKISQPLHLLLDDEAELPDNSIVISEAPEDINRKQTQLKSKILQALQAQLQADIDPSTVDPNNPPPTPQEIVKNEKKSPSDMIESKVNKMLKILKKRLNTKFTFNQGFKDALVCGEEIYWTGIQNGEPSLRLCNPLNITVIMDDSDVFIDDAIAVVEERLLTVPSIIDEFGDQLDNKTLDKLISYSNGTFGSTMSAGGFEPNFAIMDNQPYLKGVTPSNSYMGNNVNNYAVRVTRVEWIGMKQVGFLSYTDSKTGEFTEKLIVDDTFFSVFSDFKKMFPDAQLDKFWINEAWEGIKIGQDIYLNIQPKPNQRRRMDNPYYCRLGYTGLIYEARNSRSVSLIDRIKPYQYLYDAIAYKLQNMFASDMGRVFLMDLAQIPRSEDIDIEKWMYYLKEMKIGFINSFEEGKKGAATGKLAGSHFNQFQAIDLSLATSIQQYINYLQYIEQQIYYISGVNPQRMGAIKTSEAVSNVDAARQQSAKITGYLFEAHTEVKRRVYTSLVEVAKIAWRKGKMMQYINDDLAIELLNIEEFEFENSEFSVFISNLRKDQQIKEKLDQLAQIALQQQKADLSTIIDTIVNDSPHDIINTLRSAEERFYESQQQNAKAEQDHQAQLAQSQQKHEQEIEAFQAGEKQKDRDLEQYIADENNRTKIEVQELANYFKAPGLDTNNNNIPDPSEIAANALKQQELDHKKFIEQSKLSHDKAKHDKNLSIKQQELDLKKKELKSKQELENKKAAAEKSRDLTNKAIEQSKLKNAEKQRAHEARQNELDRKNDLIIAKSKTKSK